MTQFLCYAEAFRREANEKTADHWYAAQVAFEVSRLHHSFRSIFARQPPFNAGIKDFLIPFVVAGDDREARAKEEYAPGAYTAPPDLDPAAEEARRARLSKIGKTSWGRAFGVTGPAARPVCQLPPAEPGGKPLRFGGGRRKPPGGSNGNRPPRTPPDG